MQKAKGLLLLLFLSLAAIGATQSNDLLMGGGLKRVEIPFDYINNFIVVSVRLNDVLPLRFIFDTGAENTLITQHEITDLMKVSYHRRIPLLGADMRTRLYAYLALGMTLQLGEHLILQNRSLLVLEEDYFRFQEIAGVDVQGIIGSDILRRFVVRIDYRRRRITLYDPSAYDAPGENFTRHGIEFYRSKPYITATTHLPGGVKKPLKYLLDTGAALALLLHTNKDSSFQLPSQVVRANIGMGLGGFLEGYVGRIPGLTIDEYLLSEVVTSFQDMGELADSSFLNQRDGIIGNQLLERFDLIIDYPFERLYLKPTRRMAEKFVYDRSGITLVASGANLHTLVVSQVSEGSPAAEAGTKPGDILRGFNGMPAVFLDLAGVSRKLRGRPGKKIRLTLLRDGEKIKVAFQLREII
jgi:hypothetical protein